jgi:uncharacterized protein (DUF488 family)
VRIFTVGFTKKSAEEFFTKLSNSGSLRLVDVRLNNVSQLAGFAKKADLKFFLREICRMDYVHLPLLAPTQELLDRYKKKGGQWSEYERDFLDLMRSRQIETNVSRDTIAEGCLLCSEEKPEHCHRRLVAEYLKERWGDVEIVHLI